MSIRKSAKQMEAVAVDLSHKGRGFFGRREREAEAGIDAFVELSMSVPRGGVLPREVRDELQIAIERTIDALETHVSRGGSRSATRTFRDSGVVQRIYALREAQQHLMQTRHLHEGL